MFSGLNFPTLPSLSRVAASSEYSFTSAVKSSPAFAFAATSSARFFASSLERLTEAGAFFAPLYATRTCWAVIHSGLSATEAGLSVADATAEGAGVGAAGGAFAVAIDADGVAVGAGGGSSQPSTSSNGARRRGARVRSMNGVVARESGGVKLLSVMVSMHEGLHFVMLAAKRRKK